MTVLQVAMYEGEPEEIHENKCNDESFMYKLTVKGFCANTFYHTVWFDNLQDLKWLQKRKLRKCI